MYVYVSRDCLKHQRIYKSRNTKTNDVSSIDTHDSDHLYVTYMNESYHE